MVNIFVVASSNLWSIKF